MTPRIRRGAPIVRDIKVGDTVLNTASVSAELQDYVDVLLGRREAPVNHGDMTLYELSSAYYARAKEIEMIILKAEREGVIKRGDAFYRLRTGELRSFIELAQNACELGSRRITVAQMEQRMTEV